MQERRLLEGMGVEVLAPQTLGPPLNHSPVRADEVTLPRILAAPREQPPEWRRFELAYAEQTRHALAGNSVSRLDRCRRGRHGT